MSQQPSFNPPATRFIVLLLAMLQALSVGAVEGEPEQPRSYQVNQANSPLKIDGRLDEAAWQSAPWTEEFVDIVGPDKARPRFSTRAKMLWDDQRFFICAQLEEPHVWATLTKHDSVIFHDKDFEVFLDPDGDSRNYAELELNALNTTWDLLLNRTYRAGGRADDHWEIAGLETAVHVDGTLNDPSDRDKAWCIEIAIPWAALKRLDIPASPPQAGDQWRVNFSRVQWQHKVVGGRYVKDKKSHEHNWVWSPMGEVNMHQPERWGYVQFAGSAPE